MPSGLPNLPRRYQSSSTPPRPITSPKLKEISPTRQNWIMHPAGPPLPANRSCPSPSFPPCSSTSSSLIQQQKHILYGPISTLQPCAPNIHPHCVYAGVPRNPGFTSTSLASQVPIRPAKGPKWQPKSKQPRGNQHQPHHHYHRQTSHQPQYCQPVPQQHVQQPISYISKPLVLFDQCPINQSASGAPPPGTSFLIASSTFANAPYGPADPYTSAPGLTLIPQAYFKPPDIGQAFCLLPERPQPTQHYQPSLPGQSQSSFYNISTTSSLQAINSKPGLQLTTVTNPYANLAALNASQQPVPPIQIFQNQPVTLTFSGPPRDKFPMVSSVDVQAITCSKNLVVPGVGKQQKIGQENADWSAETARETSSSLLEEPDSERRTVTSSPLPATRMSSSIISKSQEERYSDESTASFDFTIEAEKMVSALCNTASSNDLGRDENRVMNENSPSFSGAAGDNVANKSSPWFADFCTEYGVSLGQNHRNTGTQTQENVDLQQLSESMRKTIFWGCNEAENILNSGNYRGNSRARWLGNMSSATKTAVTKSSTCFPIFLGDRTFVEDLINALLRISNGWLVLDNYLNKQHYPSLSEKFDRNLMTKFRSWEVSTHDLLRELITSFDKIEERNVMNGSLSLEAAGRLENQSSISFPGDVSLYTNNNLFDSTQRSQGNFPKVNPDAKSDRDSTYTLQYAAQTTSHPNFCSFEGQHQSQKGTKLRSKWTITENLSSTVDSTKSMSDISPCQNEAGFSSRFRTKNGSNSSAKVNSSTRHSLNAEFFHLRNKVMESMENCSEVERQRWGLKDHQYDFVFGTSRGPNSTTSVTGSNEQHFKINTTGSSYENPYNQRCIPRMDTTRTISQGKSNQSGNSIYLISAAEPTLDSTYVATGPTRNPNKNFTEPNCPGASRIADCINSSCGNDLIVTATSISTRTPDSAYFTKSSSSNQRELAAVPRTKMTLLSQIERNTPTANKDTKEMTASLSAWFASIRNTTGQRAITYPVEGRKNANSLTTKASTHPQATSRSAMDLNRQLHMDVNRQLQTLQNMQTIQSQPWNACNILNNKRATCKGQNFDEYDSSEDVRVYMKPGSYNVPKKRHQRKNNRRGDHPNSSRGNDHGTRVQTSRAGSAYNSSGDGKDRGIPTSTSSLLMSSSYQVTSPITNTTTAIKVAFPATPIVPPPASFSLESSPKILRRCKSVSKPDAQQDVAWKAACASAEILLEALNVKETYGTEKNKSRRHSLINESEGSDGQYVECIHRSLNATKADKELTEVDFYGASSYEVSDDDSDATCKFTPKSELQQKSPSIKQLKSNVKTDSWLIRTLNNASIVSKIHTEESDAESSVGESPTGSVREEPRQHQTVVTSTPEPLKNSTTENFGDSDVVRTNLDDRFQENTFSESPKCCESRGRSTSSTRQALLASMVDLSSDFVTRATYSETVRRSTGKSCPLGKKDSCSSRQIRFAVRHTIKNSILPVPGKKTQRKDHDKTFQIIHKSRKISGKKSSRNLEERNNEDGFSNKKFANEVDPGGDTTGVGVVKTQNKRKEEISPGWLESKSKTADRGWSVWYSSRRRQTLSPLALDKLATIHQAVWQMEGSQVLKYPSSMNASAVNALSGTIEDYCKVVKSPMFLETIGYKLKNRIYHKVDHVIRDFRRIINNSKLYHKNDTDRIANIDMLSKRLEELFDEHFAAWDFESIIDKTEDDSMCGAQASQKHHKFVVSRSTATAKKSPAIPSRIEN